jgi:hypothetical protein
MSAQISDLLLQACRLGPVQSADQSSQLQQDEVTPGGRGRPQQVGGIELWSSLLLLSAASMKLDSMRWRDSSSLCAA